ncbi:MAG: carboxypeptidase-like regulatory domain-containing protein [Chitinophagaceae bacterium]
MNKQNINNNYTGADIEKYHQGQLSARQMHALEKAALDDPFLADALEGYQFTATANADLNDLRKKLREKTGKGKVIPVTRTTNRSWLRVAALFLLIAGAGWLVYNLGFTGNKDDIALNKEEQNQEQKTTSVPRNAVPVGISSDSNTNADNTDSQKGSEKDVAIVKTKSKKFSKPKNNNQPAAEQADDLTAGTIARTKEEKADAITTQPNAAPAIPEKTSERKQAESWELREMSSHVTPANKQRNSATNQTAQKRTNSFKGQIVDDQGNPVPYAHVISENSKTGIQTDIKGNFTITSRDSLIAATVTAVGYYPNRFYLNNPGVENKIILKASEATLSEVVVTGYGTQRRGRDVAAQTAEAQPVPIGGWVNFQDYILKNIKKHEGLSGEVHLSFDVTRNGEPKNIKVEKPLCSECDKEAIRLLKEGPKWNTARSNKGKVVIQF